jgi:ABC-type antimicrobial peptide transport system permease subunit
VVLGRQLWNLFAGQLDVVPEPSVPALGLLVVVLAGIVMANLVAAVPARAARRVRPSAALRAS